MHTQFCSAPEVLDVLPWPDDVLDHLGFDPRSEYASDYWLPVLGPSTLWLLRRTANGFDYSPEGFQLDLSETARSLGLGDRSGRNSPFVRALNRCVQFGMAQVTGPDQLAVRRRLPQLSRHHLNHLSPALRARHQAWQAEQLAASRDEAQLNRARRLALSLFQVGSDWGGVERQLLRWRYPADVAWQAASWAREQHRYKPGDGAGVAWSATAMSEGAAPAPV